MATIEIYVKLRIDWDPSERLENYFDLDMKSWTYCCLMCASSFSFTIPPPEVPGVGTSHLCPGGGMVHEKLESHIRVSTGI